MSVKPPSFYEKDIERWNEIKFKKALEDRKQAKALLLKAKQDLSNLTTKNANILAPNPEDTETGKVKVFSPPKRRMSRQSNYNFCNVDFNYKGDTGVVSHLVNHRIGVTSPNKVQLDYEINLRGYQCGTTFKAKEPWMFPKPKNFKAVEVDKSAFPYNSNTTFTSPRNSSKNLTAEMTALFNTENKPYKDTFRNFNMQSVRHSFVKGNMSLAGLQEEANLREMKPPS